MRFMNSYKRLDNLCRDMNGVGVTGYIEDMERELNGSYYVNGWKSDYSQLKKYRHIRNRIAHENDMEEENLCSDKDAAWLENFYQRIIKQTDPLALCYKATQSLVAEKRVQQANGQINQPDFTYINSKQTTNEKNNLDKKTGTNADKNISTDKVNDGIITLIFVVIVIGVLYFLYFR